MLPPPSRYHSSNFSVVMGAMPRTAARKLDDEKGLKGLLHTFAPAGGPRATLIVCPASVLSNWESQLREHVREVRSFFSFTTP